MNEERHYQGIRRVQVLDDVAAVNDALENGWIILRIPDVSTQTHEPGGKMYVVSRPWFILGWGGSAPGAEVPLPKPSANKNNNGVVVPEGLPWKAYSKGGGSWIFANARGAEELAEALRSAKDFTMTIGNWRYKLQGPKEDPQKFIGRYPQRERVQT